MSIEGLDNVVPTLTRKLRLDRHGHVVARARVSIVNSNDRTVEFFAGRFSNGLAAFDKVIPGGETARLRTRLRHLDFVAVVPKDDGDFVLIDIGTLNTRTGKVVLESTDGFRDPAPVVPRHRCPGASADHTDTPPLGRLVPSPPARGGETRPSRLRWQSPSWARGIIL